MRKKLFVLVPGILFTLSSFTQEITRHDADSMQQLLKTTRQDGKRIELLLDLAQFHIFKPGENKIDFDSAQSYINQAAKLNGTIKSTAARGYLQLTESYLLNEKGQKEEGLKKVENAVRILETAGNKLYLGKAYYELSRYYNHWEQDQFPKKINWLEKAVQAFRQAKDPKLLAMGLTMLGEMYGRTRDFNAADSCLQQALAIYDSIKYEKLQHVYVQLGVISRGLGNEVQGLSYYLKALKTAQSLGDSSMQVCQINNSLASMYSRMENSEMALKYWTDGLKIARLHNDEYSILLIGTNIAVTYNNMNQPQKALPVLETIPRSFLTTRDTYDQCLYVSGYFKTYLTSKQYTLAQPYRDTLIKLLDDSLLDDQSRSSICRLLTGYYLDMKQYAKARYYLKLNLELSKGINYETGITLGSKLWYKLDSATGDFRSAFFNFHHYQSKTDSAHAINMMKQLQVLGVEYETEMKEDSIRLKDQDIALLTQQNNLQLANLKQERLVRNITIAGIVLSLLILGLLYRQYRNNHKKNQIISLKNDQLERLVTEKEWLLKEIHHRVKNNFQTVMGLLGTQTAYLKNDIAIDAINNSQQRIQAMSLIHQRLYQSNNLSSVRIADYIHELVDSLNESFNESNRIRFEIDVAPVELDLAHCIPLGLILNEAITNSFKYAFPDNRRGVIRVQLKITADNHFTLTIEDDGVGLPPDINTAGTDSMGMNLMRGLSAELGGELTVSGRNGTRVELNFVVEPVPGAMAD